MSGIFTFLLAVAVIAALWGYRSNRQRSAHSLPAPGVAAQKRYHCVEVRAGTPACEPVLQFGQTRFLSDEAPVLPVQGCSVQQCTCGYVHHDDRREDDDRRHPYGQWANMPPAGSGERRSRRDRRRSRDSTFRPSIAR